MTKVELRKKLLNQRKNLSIDFVQEASTRAQQNLLTAPAWKQADQIILYSPIRNEVQTDLLFDDIWSSGKTLLLPRCDEEQGQMSLVHCAGTHELEEGSYGILEPCSQCAVIDYNSKEFSPSLVIVPGVGFDTKGNRLGFGGGYYDRMLQRPAFNHATFVGLAYSFQIVPTLDSDPWDQSMHALCTEETLLWL